MQIEKRTFLCWLADDTVAYQVAFEMAEDGKAKAQFKLADDDWIGPDPFIVAVTADTIRGYDALVSVNPALKKRHGELAGLGLWTEQVATMHHAHFLAESTFLREHEALAVAAE